MRRYLLIVFTLAFGWACWWAGFQYREIVLVPAVPTILKIDAHHKSVDFLDQQVYGQFADGFRSQPSVLKQ